MENGQKKLKELFDGRKTFNIPDYQRAYAWDQSRQLPDFLEDIENQAVDRDYFLGTILFREKAEKESGFDVIDVVDGQQRITTIIIFMKVLLDELRTKMSDEEFQERGLDLVEETYISYKGRSKLKAISPDDIFFQEYILKGSYGEDYINTPSQRRLFNAKNFFVEKLRGRGIEELVSLKTKLDERSKVLTYSVKDDAEATLIFETTNDRGKSLTNLEKIKSFLMYRSYLVSKEEVSIQLKSIQDQFSEIFRNVESFDGNLDEDTVLRYHYIAFENWSDKSHHQQPMDSVRQKLNLMLKNSDHGSVLSFISDFTVRLAESFRLTKQILDRIEKNQSKYLSDLVCLDRLGSFYPLLIKVYKFDNTPDKRRFETTCRFLEIFSFRVLAMGRSRSDAGQTKLNSLARDFTGKFELLFTELTSEIRRLSTRKDFEDALQNTEFYEHNKSSDVSYLIWKYENYLRGSEQPIAPEMSKEEFENAHKKKHITVEHIAAQKSSGIINSDNLTFDLELLSNHKHRLGNLTFDPASANSSKKNKEVDEKNSRYFSKAPYKTQNELESFLVNGKWTVESISVRERKIIDFALRYWSPESVDYDI